MFIYKTTNLINQKVYFGMTEKDKDIEYFGSGKNLAKAIKKYGKENFSREILEYCKTTNDLHNREKYWIAYGKEAYGNNCYNIADGGRGGNLGDEVNKKLSGENNPSKRLEVRKKISEALKGKTGSLKNVKGIKHPRYGKDPWNKGKKCIQLSGENNPMWGRKRPDISEINKHRTGKQHPSWLKRDSTAKKNNAKQIGEQDVNRNRKSFDKTDFSFLSVEATKKQVQ